MAFSTFLQLIVHLFPSFDGSQRIPVLHLHETTVKEKLTGCLFHLRIYFFFFHSLQNSTQTVGVHQIIPFWEAEPHQENISLNEQHQSSATPQREKREEKQFIASVVSLQNIKIHILFVAGWTQIYFKVIGSRDTISGGSLRTSLALEWNSREFGQNGRLDNTTHSKIIFLS